MIEDSFVNEDWQIARDNGGVFQGTEDEVSGSARNAVRQDYRWTPACQRAFLEVLACTGSVTRATREVEKSPRSAYMLRFRREGTAFRLGWDAAILVAKATLHDMLMDRAVSAYEEVTVKREEGTTLRGKFDNKLGMGLLNRLDKISEAQAVQNSQAAQVQMVVQDFAAFLDLIENGGKGSEAALFFAARDPEADEEMDFEEKQALECVLDRNSAAETRIPDMLDEAPETAASRLSVWFDEDDACYKTNFPKPAGDEGEDLEETGNFWCEDYSRTLTVTEEAAHDAVLAQARQPWTDAATAARDAWFAVKEAA